MNILIPLILMFLSHTLHARIIGGRVSRTNEGPGIVQIFTSTGSCSATKISRDFLLTSAHCFNSYDGSENLQLNTRIENQEYDLVPIKVRAVIIHPNYVMGALSFVTSDLALVKVKPDTNFNKVAIRTIDFSVVKSGSRIDFWGHGCQKTANEASEYPVKKVMSTTTLPPSILRIDLGIFTEYFKENQKEVYQEHMITAGRGLGSRMASLCNGDSGGPVIKDGKVVGVNQSYVAKDMTPEGETPSGIGDLNLHTRLSTYQAWIMRSIRN